MDADGLVSRLAPGTGGGNRSGRRTAASSSSWGRPQAGIRAGAARSRGRRINADDFCMAMYDIYLMSCGRHRAHGDRDRSERRLVRPVAGSPGSGVHAPLHRYRRARSMGPARWITTGRSRAMRGSSAMGRADPERRPVTPIPTADRYTATLTVTDDAGATGVVSMSVYANAPPSASFTGVHGPTVHVQRRRRLGF